MTRVYADVALVAGCRGKNEEMVQRFLHVQQALDRLWARFVKEIVPSLNMSPKWTTRRRDMQEGDGVAILEEKTRGIWPLGRVLSVKATDTDGHRRRATVLSNGRIFERSLSRLMTVQEAD